MSLFIFKLESNQTPYMLRMESGNDDLARTDSLARFVIVEEEGEVKTFQVKRNLRQAILPSEGRQPSLSPYVNDEMIWDIIITGQRICCWSPQRIGFMGKIKENPGTASGGFSLYREIESFSIEKSEKENGSICINYYTGGNGLPFITSISCPEETARSIIDIMLSRIKQYYSNNNEFAAKNRTIDNYKQAVLSELPDVKERALIFVGPFVRAEITNSAGIEIVDKEITDLKSYAEFGIKINTDEGPIEIDPDLLDSGPTQPVIADIKPDNICPNCGEDFSRFEKPPKFCPKCGTKQ